MRRAHQRVCEANPTVRTPGCRVCWTVRLARRRQSVLNGELDQRSHVGDAELLHQPAAVGLYRFRGKVGDLRDLRAGAAFDHELEHRRKSLQITGEDDDEAMLNLLRRAHHAEVFRTLARDVEGRLTVEQVADDLSALADATVRITARWCWQS